METLGYILLTILIILFMPAGDGLIIEALGFEFDRWRGKEKPSKFGGEELLVGKLAKVSKQFSKDSDGHCYGKVRIEGEYWNARGNEKLLPLKVGQLVKITSIQGLMAEVTIED